MCKINKTVEEDLEIQEIKWVLEYVINTEVDQVLEEGGDKVLGMISNCTYVMLSEIKKKIDKELVNNYKNRENRTIGFYDTKATYFKKGLKEKLKSVKLPEFYIIYDDVLQIEQYINMEILHSIVVFEDRHLKFNTLSSWYSEKNIISKNTDFSKFSIFFLNIVL
jgi:hypothetical protein